MVNQEHIAVSEALWCGKPDLLNPGDLGLLVEWSKCDGLEIESVITFYPHMGPPMGLRCEPHEVIKIIDD